MTWRIESDPAAERELDKLDPQAAKRILTFLYHRVANLDEALKGPKLGKFWKYRAGDYRIITRIEDAMKIPTNGIRWWTGLSRPSTWPVIMRWGDVMVVVVPGSYGKPKLEVVVQSDLFDAYPSVTLLPITSIIGMRRFSG